MRIIYRQHAIKRMHERCISEIEVEQAIESGRIIEEYPNDTPYPSALLLGQAGYKAVHVVYADSIEENLRIIITVYEPNLEIWFENLRTRR
ncbi:MAG: DUF4258 domain-containing protein [Proteobacteria bacterium]|nr:DUF4258 domain-containing protein [Pseudomonadota bacterium]